MTAHGPNHRAAIVRGLRRRVLFFHSVADFAQQHHLFRCWRWRGGRRFRLEPINLLDHQENDEGQYREVEADGDEVTIGNTGTPAFLTASSVIAVPGGISLSAQNMSAKLMLPST